MPLVEREALLVRQRPAPDGLTGQDATFDQAALTKATYQAATGLLDATETAGSWNGSPPAPTWCRSPPPGPRFTTALLVHQERTIVQVARIKAATRVWPQPALLAKPPSMPPWLGRARRSRRRCDTWPRRPGGRRWRPRRHRQDHPGSHPGPAPTTPTCSCVVLVSTAAETARRTARDVGLDRGWTVEGFTRAVTTGHLQPEGGLGGAGRGGGHDGHPPHGRPAGGGRAGQHPDSWGSRAGPAGRRRGWHQLVDQALGGHALLTTVIRQHNPADREVCAAIRDGHAPQALADLQGRGRLHLHLIGRPRSRSWCMPGTGTPVMAMAEGGDRDRHRQRHRGCPQRAARPNATAPANSPARGWWSPTGDQPSSRFMWGSVRFIRPYLDRVLTAAMWPTAPAARSSASTPGWSGGGRL